MRRPKIPGKDAKRRVAHPVHHLVGQTARREDAIRQRRHRAAEAGGGGVDDNVEGLSGQLLVTATGDGAEGGEVICQRARDTPCGWQ